MRIVGIEFVSFNKSVERRIQTLACALITASLFIFRPISIPFTFIVFYYGNYWIRIFVFLYFIFIYYDRHVHLCGGRRPWLAQFDMYADYLVNYFPIKLVKTTDLDPSRNYLFCAYPHGVIAYGIITAFLTNAANCGKLFPGLRFRMLVLNYHFYVPFFREYVLSLGCCGCSSDSVRYLLSKKSPKLSKQGQVAVILTGGAEDALKCKPGTYRITLKKRKGFIKMALAHGSPLVPVVSFGENDHYDQIIIPKIRKIQYFLKNLTGLAPVIFNGRGIFQYSFGLLPRRNPINVVVGAPLEIPQIEEPTEKEVDKYHARFTQKLIELFETHKKSYIADYKNVSLIIDD